MASAFHGLLFPLSPLFCFDDIISSLQPLQAHNIVSVSTELEGRGIQNYSTLSVVRTKIAVSATVKIRDVHIKVAAIMRYRHNIFHERANIHGIRKSLENFFTDLYYISACTVTCVCVEHRLYIQKLGCSLCTTTHNIQLKISANP